ncbi:cytochrome aa3 quinol oxidase subunit IV [Aneurinibacillus terranovensis]|uniref:cytochrome aa3 quinol oxidase subunit IV n=1 Tax=Aneurinibacillus terranovensis TaxID=278991 RepID=UPI0003FE7E6B|nr:cytochrome aa3 quinol oxidase subunit IV [Aneurinibacillus terranovensis]
MSSHEQAPVQSVNHKGFPWKHVVGFILSLVLTGLAFWVVLSSGLPPDISLTISVVLAIGQVFVQLLLFMHLNESNSAWIQQAAIYFGIFIAFTVVAGSLWVMAYCMGMIM